MSIIKTHIPSLAMHIGAAHVWDIKRGKYLLRATRIACIADHCEQPKCDSYDRNCDGGCNHCGSEGQCLLHGEDDL